MTHIPLVSGTESSEFNPVMLDLVMQDCNVSRTIPDSNFFRMNDKWGFNTLKKTAEAIYGRDQKGDAIYPAFVFSLLEIVSAMGNEVISRDLKDGGKWEWYVFPDDKIEERICRVINYLGRNRDKGMPVPTERLPFYAQLVARTDPDLRGAHSQFPRGFNGYFHDQLSNALAGLGHLQVFSIHPNLSYDKSALRYLKQRVDSDLEKLAVVEMGKINPDIELSPAVAVKFAKLNYWSKIAEVYMGK